MFQAKQPPQMPLFQFHDALVISKHRLSAPFYWADVVSGTSAGVLGIDLFELDHAIDHQIQAGLTRS